MTTARRSSIVPIAVALSWFPCPHADDAIIQAADPCRVTAWPAAIQT